MAASYISVPRDLTRVKSKVMFNMTKRQLICFSMAALIGVPSFFMLKKLGSPTVAAMGMVVIMMPFFFLSMYEKNGQPLEVILGHFIEANFIRPKKRPYMTDNYYSALLRQAEAQKEVNIMNINGSIIKKYRIEKGYTQQELADVMNVDAKTIQKWESGKSGISTKNLVRLTDILNIPKINNETVKYRNNTNVEYPKKEIDIMAISLAGSWTTSRQRIISL